jgi:glycosyltransferase involved in cell wall biosynthesis
MSADVELVSVVVPTFRSRRTITACLKSIRSQTHPAVEVVVVDNHSDDGTWEMAAPLADHAIQAGPERSRQRNLGIQMASGTWILYVDSDMILAPEVIAEAVSAAQQVGAVAVFIPEETIGEGFWTRCRRLERSCYEGDEQIEAPRLVHRQWLLAQGGFNEDLIGQEDADLRERVYRRGAITARTTANLHHDEGRLTLGGVIRKRYYYGRTIGVYRRTHPGAASDQIRATLGAYWRHRARLIARPHLAVGMVTMRLFEVGAYLAGSLSVSLRGGEGLG